MLNLQFPDGRTGFYSCAVFIFRVTIFAEISIMRVVAEIPHEVMKITVFKWNEKYLIKFEVGTFEQTYKIGQLESVGLSDVKSLVTPAFCTQVLKRFIEMRTDFSEAWQAYQNTSK
jgi:hypothetical protein